MSDIVKNNIPALFAIIGAISGALISLFGTWVFKKTELRLRLWEKVLDHRIQAHEQVIELARTIRIVNTIEQSVNIRTPAVLNSQEQFELWYRKHMELFGNVSTWLSNKVLRELYLFQDYLVNLYDFLQNVKSEDYPIIGSIIKQDFIDFSGNIEKLSFKFFSHELRSLRLNNMKKWHKYPMHVTEKRIQSTDFWQKRLELENRFKKDNAIHGC
jgi:hypothetical protein